MKVNCPECNHPNDFDDTICKKCKKIIPKRYRNDNEIIVKVGNESFFMQIFKGIFGGLN